jgi:hypothetical protein
VYALPVAREVPAGTILLWRWTGQSHGVVGVGSGTVVAAVAAGIDTAKRVNGW